MNCTWLGWCEMTQEAQAAWAQALLTVGTFAFSLYYQARKEKKAAVQRDLIERAEQVRKTTLMLQIYTLKRARVARKWRAALQRHFATSFLTAREEVAAVVPLVRDELIWNESPEEMAAYGEISSSLINLVAEIESLAATAERFSASVVDRLSPEDMKDFITKQRAALQSIYNMLSDWIEQDDKPIQGPTP